MATTSHAGPLYVFGQAATPPGSTTGVAYDYNPHRGPSIFDQGVAVMDPRYPYAYQPGGSVTKTYGWWGDSAIVVCDQVPSTASTTSIAAAQTPTGGTALTLVTSSGGGITVGVSITSATTGQTVTGLLAIDGAMGAVSFGAQGGGNFWDPTKAIARAIQIHSAGNDSSGYVVVRGYDVYNYPMAEQITLSNGGTATGNKAFKYILSMTPGGTLSGSNISAGQSDTIGMMMLSNRFQYVQIFWPDTTLIASATGYTAADTTSPATATTGDVRGTYALQGVGSNGTRRLTMIVRLAVANVGSAAGLVGQTQFTE